MEKKYKPSQFNCMSLDEDGTLLLFNTFTCIFRRVHKDQAEDAMRLLKSEQDDLKKFSPRFLRDGFFVESNTDEVALVGLEYEKHYNQPTLEVSILTTHQCNCRCVYCYEDFNDGIMSEEIQEHLLYFVKDKLKNCSALHISWFGGEPLVGMSVIRNLSPKFMELCEAEHKKFTSSITTNGTLLTLETFNELKKYRVLSYQLTIDGTKDVHDIQRPLNGKGSSYDLIMKNLKDIKNAKKGNSFIIFLRINLTKKNLENIKDFLLDLQTTFGGDRRFPLNINYASNWGGTRIDAYKDNIFSGYNEMHAVYEKIHNIIEQNNITMPINGIGTDYRTNISFYNGCYVNKRNFYTVDSNGDIRKCAQEIKSTFPALGNVMDYKNENSLDREQAKWNSVTSFPVIPDKCKTCVLLPTGCAGFAKCPLKKYILKYAKNIDSSGALCPDTAEKNIDSLYTFDDPVCPDEKENLSEILKKIDFDFKGEYFWIENIYEGEPKDER